MPPDVPGRRNRQAWFVAVLVLGTALLVGPALRAPGLLDEVRYIDSALRGGELPRDISGRPLTLFTIHLQAAWAVRHNQPIGPPFGPMRTANLLLHILAATLVFRAARRRCGSAEAAALAALLFAWHPIQVMTVPHLPARGEIGVCLATLAALLCALRGLPVPGAGRGDPLWLAMCGACCLAAIGCKESGAVTPVLVAVATLDRIPPAWRTPRRVTAGAALLALLLLLTGALEGLPEHWAMYERAWGYHLTECRVTFSYLARTLWPFGLHLDRDPPLLGVPGGPLLPALPWGILLIGLVWGATRLVRSGHPAGPALSWFLLALLPTFAIPLGDVDFDSRMYVPLAGLALAAATALARLPTLPRRIAAGSTLGAFALLSVTHALPFGRSPDNPARNVLEAPADTRPHYFLASARLDPAAPCAAAPQRALEEAWKTVRLLPAWMPQAIADDAWGMLARSIVQAGSLAMAERALEISPDDPRIHQAIGRIRMERLHEYASAATALRRAHDLAPGHLGTMLLLARALDLDNQFEEAEQIYLSALRAAPGEPDVLGGFAILLARMNRLQEAEEILRPLSASRPLDGEIHSNLGEVLLRRGKNDEARREFELACENASSPETYRRAVETMKEIDRARPPGE